MKQLHKPSLWGWSLYDEDRDLDFHSVFWRRAGGNLVVDPLPLTEHESAHIVRLGGVQDIIVTNSDHRRASAELAAVTGARIWGPQREPEFLAALGARPLGEGLGAELGLVVFELEGSKTPGELALWVDGDTLIVGDLIRGHRAGALNLLPEAKLSDARLALASLRRLAALDGIEAVLVGDGWPVFRSGALLLQELLGELDLSALAR